MRHSLALLLMLSSIPLYAQEDNTRIAHFRAASETPPPPPWQVIQLQKKITATRYRIIEWDGVMAIEARADKSMSLFARPLNIDLKKTPVLCWRWRIDAPLVNANMETKEGDDYAARVYLAFTLPADQLSFSTHLKLTLARSIYGDLVPDAAINYVWDNHHPIGSQQPNAYTDRTRMIVIQSGGANAGRWISERRDILNDAIAAFNSTRIQLTLIAVATDTDNTGEQAHAGFADLHFLTRDKPCEF